MKCFIDVETIPSQKIGAREEVRANLKPPATYKKPESIAAWWSEQGEAAAEEAYRRQALDASEGELVSVAWAFDRDNPNGIVRTREQGEREYLEAVFNAMRQDFDQFQSANLDPRWPEEVFVTGHNLAFDLGFLRRRAWVHGLLQPGFMPSSHARVGRDFGCTMELWAGFGGRISLDRLCRALGIPSPKSEGIDGSQVFDLWLAGEYEAIARYNCADVTATRACWLRMSYEDDAVGVAA